MKSKNVEDLLRDVHAADNALADNSARTAVVSTFLGRARAIGVSSLMVTIFQTYSDSKLSYWEEVLAPIWGTMSYQEWLIVLRELAADQAWLYQFVFFAGRYLALDLATIARAHSWLEEPLARLMIPSVLGDRLPGPRSPRVRSGTEDLFDYESVWKRLKSEGAPLHDPSGDYPEMGEW